MPRWPYCTTNDLLNHVDRRVLAQLLSDTDADADLGTLGDSSSPAGGSAGISLAVGAAEIDSAATDGGRYTVVQLMYLADPPPAAGGGQIKPDHGVLLRRLNAALAVRHLQDRRVRPDPEAEQTRRLGTWAAEFLERIREGEGVFPAVGDLGTLAADEATRLGSNASVAANADPGGLPGADTSDVGTNKEQYPSRMFGATGTISPGDTLNTGFTDGGLGGQ